MAEQLKERKWEIMEVGEEFGPVKVVVDERRVKNFVYAVDDFDPAYLGGKGGRIAPPTVLGNALLRITMTKYNWVGSSGLHARQEYEFFNPVAVGEEVTVTGRYIDKFIRREKEYMVLEAEARDSKGKLVLRGRATDLHGLKRGTVKDAPSTSAPAAPPPAEKSEPAPSGPVVEKASKDVPIGAQVPPLVKTVLMEQMVVYTGTERKNIHNDPEFARNAGLPNAISQGLTSVDYISQAMGSFFGKGWQRGGKVSVAFVSPVYAGDTITVKGVVKEIAPEGKAQRITVDVWCENQSGKKVTVGTASGLVK